MEKMDFNLNNILRMNQQIIDKNEHYPKKRNLFYSIKNRMRTKKNKLIGIVGPRGVGKTVILKQILKEKKEHTIYISLDNFSYRNIKTNDFMNIVMEINKRYEKTLFLFDEIHNYKNFSSLLKMFYDFTNIRIVFTSSVAIIFPQLQQDLTRRLNLEYLYPFDYKEYLFFVFNIKIPYISINEIIAKNNFDQQYIGKEQYFKEYLKGELYPFTMETDNEKNKFKNILERVLYEDLKSVLSLRIDELQDISDLLRFIGSSEVDGISFSSLSNNLKLSIYKVKQYIEALEKVFILNIIYPKGTNIKKEPKILMLPPYRLLYREYNDAIGGLREDFIVQMLKQKGFNIFYLKGNKGEKRPDYLIDYNNNKIVIEVGGKNKGYSQFKGLSDKYIKIVFRDNYDYNKNNGFPLFIAGCLKT